MGKLKNIVEGWRNRFRKVSPAEEALFRDRLKICENCPRLQLGICTACGCVVKAKTHALDEDCPENKWRPYLYEGFVMNSNQLPYKTWLAFVAFLRKNSIPLDKESMYPWDIWEAFKDSLRTK